MIRSHKILDGSGFSRSVPRLFKRGYHDGLIHRLSFNRALESQDPYGRIRFYVGQQSSPLWRQGLLSRFPNAINVEAFALPFWTLLYTWSIQPPLVNFKGGEEHVQACGLTISAVDASHWANGLILKDDPDMLLKHVKASEGSITTNTRQWIHHPQSEERGMENTRYFPDEWNPIKAPLFAHGYARRLPDVFYASIRGHARNIWGLNYAQDVVINQFRPPFAFPHYRVIFKIDMDNGDIIVGDGSKGLKLAGMNELHYFRLKKNHPKAPGVMMETGSQGSWQYWRASPLDQDDFDSSTMTKLPRQQSGSGTNYRLIGPAPVGDEFTVKRVMADLAVSSLGSSVNWKNQNILSCDVYPGNSLAGAWDYALSSMQQEIRPAPAFPGLRSSSSRRSESFPTRPNYRSPISSSTTHAPRESRPTYVTVNESTIEKPEATFKPAPQSNVTPFPEPRSKRQSEPIQQTLPAPKPDPIQPKPRPPKPSTSKPFALPKPSKPIILTTPVPSIKLSEPILDPLGYYHSLGITPTRLLIDRTKGDLAEEMIASARRRLSWQFHPDRQGGNGDKLAHINFICDLLKNLSYRLEYSRGLSTRR